MNNKHKKTLQLLFSTPIPKAIPWGEVESLLKALGVKITEGNGSRVKYDMEGITLAVHRPHNPKTTRAYHIPLLKDFLQKIGAKP